MLTRAESIGAMTAARGEEARTDLERASAHWTLLELEDEVSEQASRPFPVEPLRTLDAIHMASALVARAAVPALSLLSLDNRVLANARALGFELLID